MILKISNFINTNIPSSNFDGSNLPDKIGVNRRALGEICRGEMVLNFKNKVVLQNIPVLWALLTINYAINDLEDGGVVTVELAPEDAQYELRIEKTDEGKTVFTFGMYMATENTEVFISSIQRGLVSTLLKLYEIDSRFYYDKSFAGLIPKALSQIIDDRILVE